MTAAVALLALVAVLVFAVLRPRGLSEVVAAVPAAVLVIATGGVSLPRAGAEVRSLLPVVGFLVAVLVLAELCEQEGLFDAVGQRLAPRSNGGGRRSGAHVLFARTVVAAAVTTAALSLDATVILLTPVVLLAAREVRVPSRPHTYACAHLANSASLLLPVSNLTNLLAVAATGLSFRGFTARMALPWLVAVVVEWAVLRTWFRTDLRAVPVPSQRPPRPYPRAALIVVVCVLAGFVAGEPLGVAPVWVAAAGAVVLAVHTVRRRRLDTRAAIRSANVGFAVFVLALGVVVAAVASGPLGRLLGHLVPAGASLPALLGIAVVAAVASNLLNNLPAILLLLPLVAPAGAPAVPAVLAALIGVNVGPNLTYVGSLAVLLWRRVLGQRDEQVRASTFHALGALSVPVTLVACVLALWLPSLVVPF
ncbi:MAG: SLC13 family permease [Actinomycetales bacterium]